MNKHTILIYILLLDYLPKLLACSGCFSVLTGFGRYLQKAEIKNIFQMNKKVLMTEICPMQASVLNLLLQRDEDSLK